jgi:PAS domain S-box-containing protein
MRVRLQSLFSITPASLTLCTILVVVILCVFGTPILDLLELKTYDLRLLSRGHVRPLPAVVLAVIDEKSLVTEGRWPWPRSKLAALVDRLSHDGARVIGFDMAFLEPDENSQNDLALANAIKQSSAAVVLGYFFLMRPADLDYWLEQQAIDQQLKRISAAKYPLVLYKGQGMDMVPFLRAYVPKSNLEIFTAATASSGHLSLRSDQDDVVRWMPLIIQGGEELFPPLAVWCAWHYLGRPQLTVQAGRYGVEGIQMGNRFIPTDESGQLLINYLGPPKTFPHVSISDILNGQLPGGTFTDKIVLVGATAVGTHNLLSTPVNPLYPAVEVHATVIDNILTQNFLTRPSWSKTYDLLAIITLGVLIGISLPRLGALKGLLCATGLGVLYLVITCWLFVHTGVWLTLVYPLLALSTNYLGLSFNSMAQQLRQAFRNLQGELEERQRAEEALRQSEAHYRALVEGSLQGISIVKRDGTRVFANSALTHMLGYARPEELVGRSIWEHTAPHELSRFRAAFEAHLRGEAAPTHHEYQAVKKDGTLIWVERLASPMTLNGEPVILVAYLDITERKRLETQLRQAQKMQAIGTLAGGIAHDFNNILTAILGYTELAMQERKQDRVLGHYLQRVLTAGNRAKDLVQQILAFSRQTEVKRTPIQLHLLIREVLGLLRAALPSTIAIRPVIDSHAGSVLADPTQIHQVVLNLCTNAAHAMRETGGVIEILLEAVEVTTDRTTVAADLEPGPYVRLTVRDTGHGMAPEVMERIFEPFFTTKNMGEGTGMGLAVVHGIVTSHGGAITVESTPGQGATFAVYLPRLGDPTTSAVHTEEPLPGGSERILFVDDEEALAHLWQTVLEHLGYNVVVCTNSLEALNVFRAAPQSFDLVITDYTMPTMTGEGLAQELRCVRPDIPIILYTGFSDTMTAERAQALEIDALVLKPLRVRDFNLAIRQVLAQRLAQEP